MFSRAHCLLYPRNLPLQSRHAFEMLMPVYEKTSHVLCSRSKNRYHFEYFGTCKRAYRTLLSISAGNYSPPSKYSLKNSNGETYISSCRLSLPRPIETPKVADLPEFLDQVMDRFPLLTDLSMMRNPACPGLMDIQRPDMEACRLYRTYVVFRAPQLVTVDGVDVTEEVGYY